MRLGSLEGRLLVVHCPPTTGRYRPKAAVCRPILKVAIGQKRSDIEDWRGLMHVLADVSLRWSKLTARFAHSIRITCTFTRQRAGCLTVN